MKQTIDTVNGAAHLRRKIAPTACSVNGFGSSVTAEFSVHNTRFVNEQIITNINNVKKITQNWITTFCFSVCITSSGLLLIRILCCSPAYCWFCHVTLLTPQKTRAHWIHLLKFFIIHNYFGMGNDCLRKHEFQRSESDLPPPWLFRGSSHVTSHSRDAGVQTGMDFNLPSTDRTRSELKMKKVEAHVSPRQSRQMKHSQSLADRRYLFCQKDEVNDN